MQCCDSAIEWYYLCHCLLFIGSFSVLSDKLNENLKKVFEAEPSATEPKIYQGTVIL